MNTNYRMLTLFAFLSPLATGIALAADTPASNVAPASSAAPLMRIVAPVRLSSEPGEKLSAEIEQTRKILERFQKGGFEYAVWAVDTLPAKDEALAPWCDACLQAFPGKVIVALDAKLENNVSSIAPERLKAFLGALLNPPATASAGRRATARDAILLLNFDRLNNFECASNITAAVKTVTTHAGLARETSPQTPIWLFVDDDARTAAGVEAWAQALGNRVDGFYLHGWHGIKLANGPATAPLFATGKPVVRGGFRYMSPRIRPGLEEDLRAQYVERIIRYEGWLQANHYAGYSRAIGTQIPQGLNINMDFVPTGTATLGANTK